MFKRGPPRRDDDWSSPGTPSQRVECDNEDIEIHDSDDDDDFDDGRLAREASLRARQTVFHISPEDEELMSLMYNPGNNKPPLQRNHPLQPSMMAQDDDIEIINYPSTSNSKSVSSFVEPKKNKKPGQFDKPQLPSYVKMKPSLAETTACDLPASSKSLKTQAPHDRDNLLGTNLRAKYGFQAPKPTASHRPRPYDVFKTGKHTAKPQKEQNFNKAASAASYRGKKMKNDAEEMENSEPSESAKFFNLESKSTKFEGFRMANGSTKHITEVKNVTPLYTKPKNNSNTSQPLPTSDDAPPPPPTDPNDLKNHPALANFDKHIIEHVQSEIICLDNNLTWDDVAGLESAKQALWEIVVLPVLRKDVFCGIRAPPKGVLLFGPPGTGKTLIGKCVANQAKATFFNISASSLTSKWIGEGEKLVRVLFQIARLKMPSIIFIDEVDSLLSTRKDGDHESSIRIKTELLVQMDGLSTNNDESLLVLGATNKPEALDEAARRRFSRRLYIALPEQPARKTLIKALLQGVAYTLTDDDCETIAERTAGFSGADMRQLCTEAAMGPIREIANEIETIEHERIRGINLKDFEDALANIKSSVLESELVSYLEWDKSFGSHSKNAHSKKS